MNATTMTTMKSKSNTQAYEEFVNLANILLDDGNLDTYTMTREELEAGARLFLAPASNSKLVSTLNML